MKHGVFRRLLILILTLTVFCFWSTAVFAAENHEHEGELGAKFKSMQSDHELSNEELQLQKYLHVTYANDNNSPYGSGANLYGHTLIVTGDAIGEQQVYAVKEIEDLINLSWKTDEMNALNLTKIMDYKKPQGFFNYTECNSVGLDLIKFLQLCGADEEELWLCFYDGNGDEQFKISWKKLQKICGKNDECALLLVVGENEKPLTEETDGPIKLVQVKNGKVKKEVTAVSKIVIGKDKKSGDTDYRLHNREIYNEFLNKTFTVEIYDKNNPDTIVKSRVFTTQDLEDLAQAYPQYVISNYYGMIGNGMNLNSVGLGGWLDYYTGIDLWWLLDTQVGLPGVNGYADLVDREGLVYGNIEDLRYLDKRCKNSDEYTVTTNEAVDIPQALPMIAFAKNGYPLLAEHDHTAEGYVAYNTFNQNLESQGVMTEVGVVKNHSGPFVACLGNYNGYYGGYQIETGGDCVAIRLYIDIQSTPIDDLGENEDTVNYALSHGLISCINNTFDGESDYTINMLAESLGALSGLRAEDFENCTTYLDLAINQGWIEYDNPAVFNANASLSGEEFVKAIRKFLQSFDISDFTGLTDDESASKLASNDIASKELQKAETITRLDAANSLTALLHYLQGY